MACDEEVDILEFWKNPTNKQTIFESVSLDYESDDELELKSVQPTGNPSPEHKCSPKNVQYHFISDKEYTQYPYNCVGKFFQLSPAKKILYHTTAFYIGNGKILTVAHAFDKTVLKRDGEVFTKKFNKGIFVPAMTDNEDTNGKHYSYFEGYEGCIHKEYKINKKSKDIFPHYNICFIKIRSGTEKADISKLQSISLRILEEEPHKKLKILGYGLKSYNIKEIQNSKGKMMKFKGDFKSCKQDRPSGVTTAMLTPAVWRGMSGGPWLDEKLCAQGLQSGVLEEISYSPHYTPDLLSFVIDDTMDKD